MAGRQQEGVRGRSWPQAWQAAMAALAVSLTLTSAGPPSTLEVGVGAGIPNGSGAGCNLMKSVVTGGSSSPQLTIAVDSGAYCARVFDVGNLTGDATFSVSVLHP